MNNNITKRLTPEEYEVQNKQQELLALESDLAQQELDLATLEVELHLFEKRYLCVVGVLYAQLDDIEAQILESQSRLNPFDLTLQEQAAKARELAYDSAQAAYNAVTSKEEKEFKPSDRLKKLYREIAKAIHPDHATDEEERLRRDRLMAEANLAYKEGDEVKLQAILLEWESSPESVKGDGPGAELVRLIRKIAQIKHRLYSIKEEFEALQISDLNQLRMKSLEAEREGRDLLTDMALLMTNKITDAKQRLASASSGAVYERL